MMRREIQNTGNERGLTFETRQPLYKARLRSVSANNVVRPRMQITQ